jgi:DNA-binding winged helix-turn-helix (wHTH) protein/TolB-like protein/tetratricopeptide (TPR) repeat protein
MQLSGKRFYEFGPYRLDAVKRLLLREDEVVPLKSKVFDTLLVLVEESGRVLEKDELMKKLWPDTVVEEANLSIYISTLRRALGERPGENRYIVTIPGQGYRFVAEVRESGNGQAELLLQERTSVSVTVETEDEKLEPFSLNDIQKAEVALPPAPSSPRRRLRYPLLLAGLLLAGLAGAGYYWWATRPALRGLPVKSIAVLPFKQLNGGQDDYLGLGLADVLITRLDDLRQIKVRPTSAILRYRGTEQDAVAIGREQKVDAVLEGSIQRSGNNVRVTVQLVSVQDGAPLWSGLFDQQMADSLVFEDAITQRLVRVLALKLSDAERRTLAKRSTDNAEAYQLYLKGRFFWNKRTGEGVKKGLECFEQAVKLDPNYALAYVGIADCYFIELIGLPHEERRVRMKAAAMKALELDETLAEAHASLAWVKCWYEWDWAGAEQEFKRALELNPNYATAHHWYALYFSFLGRNEEALAEIKQAAELDPLSLIINANVGYILMCARLYDQAIASLHKTLEMDPTFSRTHIWLGESYTAKGMYAPAITELQQAVKLCGDEPKIKGVLGHAYAKAGKRTEAVKILRELDKLCEKQANCLDDRAILRTDLEGKPTGFEMLQQAVAEHNSGMTVLKVHPYYDDLRSDPRFTDLLRRVGLAQ